MNDLIDLIRLNPVMTFATGFAIFFWGIRFLSQGLQDVFGTHIKELISRASLSKSKNILAGFLVSLVVQSKGITAGMIFELANAGLVRLSRGLWLISGANLATIPLVFLLYYINPKVLVLLIPLGILPPLIFTKGSLSKIGKVLSGFGLLGMGLQLMFSASEFIMSFSPALPGFGTFSLTLVIALLFSMLVRSSFVGLAPAMALISHSTPLTLFWVAGANVGSAIISMRRAREANVFSRRVVVFHLLFNLIGLGMLVVLGLVVWNAKFSWWNLPFTHALANLAPLLILYFFQEPLRAMVKKIVPDEAINENFELRLLGKSKDLIPSVALAQTFIQIEKFKEIVDRMFALTRKYIESPEVSAKTLQKIKEYERITDNIRNEIVEYLGEVIMNPLSKSQSKSVQTMMRVAFELEKIADYLDKVATYHTNINLPVQDCVKKEFFEFFDTVEDFYYEVTNTLRGSLTKPEKDLLEKSRDIRSLAEEVRIDFSEKLQGCGFNNEMLQEFNDILVALRKIRSHCQNIHLSLMSI